MYSSKTFNIKEIQSTYQVDKTSYNTEYTVNKSENGFLLENYKEAEKTCILELNDEIELDDRSTFNFDENVVNQHKIC